MNKCMFICIKVTHLHNNSYLHIVIFVLTHIVNLKYKKLQ